MEYNKKSLANGLLVVVTITAVFLVGFLIFGNAGVDVTDTEQVSAGVGESNLNDEDQRVFEKERQAFFGETQDLRQDIYKKRLELQSELAKKNPDAQKAVALHKDISKLAEEFDQKRLAFILKMKKINPNSGRRGFRGIEKDDDDVNCPNYGRQYGHHMGRRHGYGMGPGMMGPGYGMGPGHGRGPGWMGREPSQGEMQPGAYRLETPLQEDGARAVVENYLQSTRNPNLKLGKITEQGDAFEAEIVTKEGSLVDELLVDKSTGWIHPAN
ncbi:MAG: periplasmic heavy metal sensor [Desulfobacterales bacterium]